MYVTNICFYLLKYSKIVTHVPFCKIRHKNTHTLHTHMHIHILAYKLTQIGLDNICNFSTVVIKYYNMYRNILQSEM